MEVTEIDDAPDNVSDNTISNLRAQSNQRDMQHIQQLIERKRRISVDLDERAILKMVKNSEGYGRLLDLKWLKSQQISILGLENSSWAYDQLIGEVRQSP